MDSPSVVGRMPLDLDPPAADGSGPPAIAEDGGENQSVAAVAHFRLQKQSQISVPQRMYPTLWQNIWRALPSNEIPSSESTALIAMAPTMQTRMILT